MFRVTLTHINGVRLEDSEGDPAPRLRFVLDSMLVASPEPSTEGDEDSAAILTIKYRTDEAFAPQKWKVAETFAEVCTKLEAATVAAELGVALAALDALLPAENKLPYFTSGTAAALATITDQARTFLAKDGQKAQMNAVGISSATGTIGSGAVPTAGVVTVANTNTDLGANILAVRTKANGSAAKASYFTYSINPGAGFTATARKEDNNVETDDVGDYVFLVFNLA